MFHRHGHRQDHLHGAIDPVVLTTQRGMWAIKWSFVGLVITAGFQLVIVWLSGSMALLADTIHNFGDAATSIPLGIAFALARWKPSRRFPYGYGRVEDLAGVVIVLTILLSAWIAGYESIVRLLNPRPVAALGAVVAASVIGFLGNEAVAVFRIRVGKEIGSAALTADGYHARVDGLTSLAVLVGAAGVWLGYPVADPIVGLVISIVILRVVWYSGQAVFTRLLDGVDPDLMDEIQHIAGHARGVRGVTDVRVRWLGHRLHAEINLAVARDLSVSEAHAVALEARHEILHHVPHLSDAIVHVDPEDASGEAHHRVVEHSHGNSPVHSHP